MNFRGLELHGKSFWSHRKIERCLDVCRDYALNALVIHDSDFMTDFIFPSSIFNPSKPWSGAPSRRGENALHNNMVYFRDILKRAARKGIDVWIEIKEITFPDEIIEKHPDVLKDGVICPTDPLWLDLIKAKYTDLAELYPGIKGVIVSAGSPEGKTALSQKKCKCSRCASADLSDWYVSILDAMYRILSPNKISLAVREFSYNVNHQKAITEAMNRMPGDVIYCIKVTPHDFYPTFPDNSLIADVNDRPKWIEYDTMGQYYGWGVIPCLMYDDITARFRYADAHRVDGALLRVEWERVNDYYSVDSPNRMNLHIAAACAAGEKIPLDSFIRTWLAEERIIYTEDDFAVLKEYITQTWDIIKKALYINDFVLNDSSMVPQSIERAWWSMADKHSLAEWFPARQPDLEMDEPKADAYLKEKESALEKIVQWKKRINSFDRSTELILFLKKTINETERYILINYYYARVCILAGLVDKAGEAVSKEKAGLFKRCTDELEHAASENAVWLENSDYTHHMYLLFNPDRCLALVKGARARLEKLHN